MKRKSKSFQTFHRNGFGNKIKRRKSKIKIKTSSMKTQEKSGIFSNLLKLNFSFLATFLLQLCT
jgi:hypothetical protein